MIWGGTIHPTPELVSEACRRRADIGVTVVPVYTPGTQHALHVAIVPRSPDVIHDLVTMVLDNGCADFGGEGVQHLIPGGALPLTLAALACAFQGIEDALRVIDLVDGSRSLGAVASATAWMIRVALEFFDTACLLVYIGQQATGSFAVNADGGYDGVVLFDFAWPGFGIVFNPVMPALGWRTGGQVSHGHLFSAWGNVLL